jgi:hypothetical protein
MKAFTLAALAAGLLAVPTMLASGSAQAQAGWNNVAYVGACSYNSRQWKERGIVSCTPGFRPLGEPGARWNVGRGQTMCWNTNTPAGKDHAGWWGPCKR